MADVVIARCLFTFLLINACYGGVPGLAETEDSTGSPGAREQLLDDTLPLDKMMVHSPSYKCHQCEGEECSDSVTAVCTGALSCYKSTVRDAGGALRHSRGCSDRTDHYQFTCRHKQTASMSKRHLSAVNVSCCFGQLCNGGAFPALAADAAVAPLAGAAGAAGWAGWGAGGAAWRLCAALAAAALALAAAAGLGVLLLRRTHRKRASRGSLHKLGGAREAFFAPSVYGAPPAATYYEEGSQSGGGGGALRATAAGDSTLREFLSAGGGCSSGSGSGLPLMVQRTLSKQVSLLECVGKGRFGEVWRGLWYADSVAVKIFFSRDEASWQRETEIYSTVLLRHDNILAYIGSDMTSRNSCTQLWLITHFHPLGSLYEYLQRASLSRHQMMLICLSVVNGLLHLHTDIHGTQGKPAIAHRDIKSKNVLVKLDGSCCISDFGAAVTQAQLAAAPPPPPPASCRYWSPEMLDDSMNVSCFESHRRCDIYALALVVWEVVSRTGPPPAGAVAGAAPYEPPYGACTGPCTGGAEPSARDMRKLVAVDGARPPLPPHKRVTHPTMQGIHSLMRECWHQNPSVRLPALRVKKTLAKLAAADNSIHLDQDSEVSV